MNDSQTIIDAGKEFDFGKTSADYARFRDIYPDVFYEQLTSRNLCINGQSVLDVGTGTGVKKIKILGGTYDPSDA